MGGCQREDGEELCVFHLKQGDLTPPLDHNMTFEKMLYAPVSLLNTTWTSLNRFFFLLKGKLRSKISVQQILICSVFPALKSLVCIMITICWLCRHNIYFCAFWLNRKSLKTSYPTKSCNILILLSVIRFKYISTLMTYANIWIIITASL